jgi:hypothetical protein
MIVVPSNVNPGETFCLEVHNDAEGGATVTIAEVIIAIIFVLNLANILPPISVIMFLIISSFVYVICYANAIFLEIGLLGCGT